jgi:ribosomal protein S18 acetylase RimI-like enzyme
MRLVHRIHTTFHRRVDLLVRPAGAGLPGEDLPGVRLARLDDASLPAYAVFRGRAAAAEAERRLARGELCFAGWDGGEIVHVRWAALRRAHVDYLHRDLLMRDDDAYIFDIFTDSRQRRRGVATAVSHQAVGELHGLGCRRLVAVVAVENEAGQGISGAFGWRRIGRLACLRLGPLQIDLGAAPAGEGIRVVKPGQPG